MSLMAQILAAEWVKIRLTFFSPPVTEILPLFSRLLARRVENTVGLARKKSG